MLCDICFIRSSSRRGVANKRVGPTALLILGAPWFHAWLVEHNFLGLFWRLVIIIIIIITKCLQVWEDMSVWFCFATFLLLLDCEQSRQHALELHTRSQLICYCFLWNKCWLFELGFELSCVTKYSKCVLLQVIIRGLLFIYSIKTQKNCSLMTDTNFVKWFFGTILS